MSWRERVTKSACASLLATSVISAAGEGRGRVSTTLMSDVLCIGSREEARIEASRKGFWGPRPAGVAFSGKKVAGRPPPPPPPLLFFFFPKTPPPGGGGKKNIFF